MITIKKLRGVPIYPDFYYALADKDMRQCTEWLTCRESVQLRMSAAVINGKIKVLRLLISGEGKNRLGIFDFNGRIKNLEEFLNLAGRKIGVKNIRISEVRDSGKKKVFLIRGDRGWIHSPPLFSLLTLYARIGIFHKLGDSLNETVRNFMHGSYKRFRPEESKIKWKKKKDFWGKTFGLRYRVEPEKAADFDPDAYEDELSSCGNDSELLGASLSFRYRLMEKGTRMFPKKMIENHEICEGEDFGICDYSLNDWKEMEREYDEENEDDEDDE